MTNKERAALKDLYNKIRAIEEIDSNTKGELICSIKAITNYFMRKNFITIDKLSQIFEIEYLSTIIKGAKDNAEELIKWDSTASAFTQDNYIYWDIVENYSFKIQDDVKDIISIDTDDMLNEFLVENVNLGAQIDLWKRGVR